MKDVKKIFFVFPVSLVLILMLTNLLSAKLLLNSNNHFIIWFVFLIISFALGWVIKKGFGWKSGVRIILLSTIVGIIISLILVAIFKNSFDVSNSFIENIVNYSLRVFVTGLFAVFGLFVAEVLLSDNQKQQNENTSETNFGKEEAEILIKEAKLKAEKIIFDAERSSQKLTEQKAKIEAQLRELIQTEREVIRKYESEDLTEENIELENNN